MVVVRVGCNRSKLELTDLLNINYLVLFAIYLQYGMIFAMEFEFKEELLVLYWLRTLHRKPGYCDPLFLLKKPFGLTWPCELHAKEAK